jgi:cullin 3
VFRGNYGHILILLIYIVVYNFLQGKFWIQFICFHILVCIFANTPMASKMRIAPFKPQVLMDRNTAKKTWEQLESSFNEIYDQNNSSLQYEQVYRLSYNMVLQKHGDLLYQGVNDTFKTHTTTTYHEIAAVPDQTLLHAILKAWEAHRRTICMIRDVVMYMDKTHIVHKKLTPVITFRANSLHFSCEFQVFDMGVLVFRQLVIYNPDIRTRLRRMLLENILNERNGEMVDVGVLRGLLSMFIEMGLDGEKVYENEFETPFLSTTRTFYREESLLFISQNTCPDYVCKVEGRLSEEAKRVVTYLAKTTEAKLKKIVESELIVAHAQNLVDMEHSGCECMFRDGRMQDLAALYSLFARVPACVDRIRDCMCKYVKSVGYDIVSSHDKIKDPPVAFAQKLLDLKTTFNDIVNKCFEV